jgi:hypothetical protein
LPPRGRQSLARQAATRLFDGGGASALEEDRRSIATGETPAR